MQDRPNIRVLVALGGRSIPGSFEEVMPRGPIRFLLSRMLGSQRFKTALWSRWYRYVEKVIEDKPIWFMNYGFLPANGQGITLRPEDEPDRTSIQLYDVVTRAVDLTGRAVLEVSCGRGGGVRFLSAYKTPRVIVGLDRTEKAVAFCSRHHGETGGRFLCGDALELPFADSSLDVVINVEASHCYPNFARFLSEVRRILRYGGSFLLADMRKHDAIETWRHELRQSNMELLEEEEITQHVVRALESSSDRVSALIRENAPRWARRFMAHFAATKGTAVYNQLKSGEVRYVRFVLRRS